tara:strand:+ start:11836 stop:12633 length:798 start_codon:yes stop_codon:yes gene_type:complete
MIKLGIVSSKKYLKSKQTSSFIEYLNKEGINFEKIIIENLIKDINSKDYLDLIVSVGGDGTALKAMKIGWINSVPVLNLGSGRVGYLVNAFDSVDLKKLINSNFDNFKIRTPIIQNKNEMQPAFNEIVLIKNSPTRMLDMQIETYGQHVKLRADGIIISTSMGSTAYNYSAGGPIVQTSLESMIITPISPFTKFPRSIVLDKSSEIKVTILKNQEFSVQFDGSELKQIDYSNNSIFSYKLSSNHLKVLEENNNPKLDHFLNQILR